MAYMGGEKWFYKNVYRLSLHADVHNFKGKGKEPTGLVSGTPQAAANTTRYTG